MVFLSEIQDPLCEGGRRRVAVKGLQFQDRNLSAMEEFVKEIKLTIYIQDTLRGHPNIVTFFGIDIDKFFQSKSHRNSLCIQLG